MYKYDVWFSLEISTNCDPRIRINNIPELVVNITSTHAEHKSLKSMSSVNVQMKLIMGLELRLQ